MAHSLVRLLLSQCQLAKHTWPEPILMANGLALPGTADLMQPTAIEACACGQFTTIAPCLLIFRPGQLV